MSKTLTKCSETIILGIWIQVQGHFGININKCDDLHTVNGVSKMFKKGKDRCIKSYHFSPSDSDITINGSFNSFY